MKVIIIGDVHGSFNAANASVQAALKEHPDAQRVIQLGDLGDGWPTSDGPRRWIPDFELPIYVVDGNHENFDLLESGDVNPRLYWMNRGEVLTLNGHKLMFFGGATSPDLKDRTIGLNWWPQESITRQQVEKALEYDGTDLTTMFCHERADVFKIPSQWRNPLTDYNIGASDRAALSQIVKKFRPKWYFHGHWHWGHVNNYNIRHNGMDVDRYTRVISCPQIDNYLYTWTVFDGRRIWRNW